MMRRACLVASFACLALVASASAQQAAAETFRVVMVNPTGPATQISKQAPHWRILFDELERRGFAEGRNLHLERRSGERGSESVADLIRELPDLKPDLVFAFGDSVLVPLKGALPKLRIVGISTRPVGSGLAESFARPGGNFTGVTHTAGLDVFAKHVQLLHDIAPTATHIGFLGPASWAWDGDSGMAVRQAAQARGLKISGIVVAAPIDESAYRRAFARMAEERIDAVYVDGSLINARFGRLIVDLSAQYRLPAIYPCEHYKRLGGLAAYANEEEMWRDAAEYIVRVLNGEKPAEMPIRQPTRFIFSINLTTAKALGLSLSPALLSRADEVIE